jgi:serpin B
VRVYLPKFKVTCEFRLDKSLAALGMTDAFDAGKADFTGMGGRQGDLFISAVVHKAFVEVNEEGTEAAAATGVVGGRDMSPPVFRADHPFVYLIRDNQTGSVLFLGRVTDPTR